MLEKLIKSHKREKDKSILIPSRHFDKETILPMTIDIADISKHIFCFTKQTGDSTVGLIQLSQEVVAVTQDVMLKMNHLQSKMITIEKALKTINHMVTENSIHSEKTMDFVRQGTEQLEKTALKIQDVVTYYTQVQEHLALLHNYSKSISSITTYIDNIAAKTSMLAINANIEAARGGASSEGFLVITNQIRSLAEQSKQFSTAINTTLGHIQKCIHQMDRTTQVNFKKIEATQYSIKKLNVALSELVERSHCLDENIKLTTQTSRVIETAILNGEEGVQKLEDILNHTSNEVLHMEKIIDNQQTHIHTLENVNEQIKELSAHQLHKVMGTKVKEELQQIAEALHLYAGEKDLHTLETLCRTYHAKNIYFGNEEGIFTYSNDPTSIGLNLFSFNKDFKSFYQSNSLFKIFPLSRNLFTGDITQFVGIKCKDSKMFISVSFELDELIHLYHK